MVGDARFELATELVAPKPMIDYNYLNRGTLKKTVDKEKVVGDARFELATELVAPKPMIELKLSE